VRMVNEATRSLFLLDVQADLILARGMRSPSGVERTSAKSFDLSQSLSSRAGPFNSTSPRNVRQHIPAG